MSVFALVKAGTITNTAISDNADLLPAGTWVMISGNVGVGWGAKQTSGIWSFTAPAQPPEPLPTLAQTAATALYSGISLSLSGSMDLSATLFPCDPDTTSKTAKVILTLVGTQKFPGGATTFPMKDSSGTWHTFTAAQYIAVEAAISSYVATLNLIIDGNPLNATVLPPASEAVILP